MSRALKQELSPNYEQFRKKVMLAKGSRTLTQFSKDAGVNPAYLSKVISLKYNKPASPTFIGKLASVAENGVSYEELMSAAGFDPEKHVALGLKNDYEKKLEDRYNEGYIAGFIAARNAVFDAINAGGDVNDACACLIDMHKQKDVYFLNVPDVFVSGAVVEDKESNEEYILISPFKGTTWLSFSPSADVKPVDEKDISGTGHFIPSDLVLGLFNKMEKRR